jgi:hypothetical protein
MQTLTRSELSQLITGGIEMTEGPIQDGKRIVTYKVLDTGETFVQVVKEHECYQVEPALAEELKADLENSVSVASLEAKLEAEKLKPSVDFKQLREDKIQAEIAAAEAARIEAEKADIEDAIIIEEVKEEPALDGFVEPGDAEFKE